MTIINGFLAAFGQPIVYFLSLLLVFLFINQLYKIFQVVLKWYKVNHY